LAEALLEPTRIYVKSCLPVIRAGKGIKALAHITGGGFPDNIPRVLPEGVGVRLDLARVPVPSVFKWLASAGGVAEAEMLRTFNCGIGLIVVVEQSQAAAVAALLKQNGEENVVQLGDVVAAGHGVARVVFDGRLDLRS
jgi:phosphoribosylformylglycinamidine cyclo-ligase